jgi:hypothetical protein
MSATQPSQLLPSLFTPFDPSERLTVLHIGPALPETGAFFSRFRCKLFFVDLFSELPIAVDDDSDPSLTEKFSDLLDFPPETSFDVCLFWDLFNFLDAASVVAFLFELRPYLHSNSLAHGFAVYNLKSPQSNQLYGIEESGILRVRSRPTPLPGYAPHPQSKLKSLVHCFNIDRSVLLADSRLELLLRADLNEA